MNRTVKYQGKFFRIVGFAGKRFLFSPPLPSSIFFAPALTFAQRLDWKRLLRRLGVPFKDRLRSFRGLYHRRRQRQRKRLTFKINSRFFKLCRVYSNFLKMANVGEFPWSWFLVERTLSLEREKEIRRRLFTSSMILAIRHFHVVVVQGR